MFIFVTASLQGRTIYRLNLNRCPFEVTLKIRKSICCKLNTFPLIPALFDKLHYGQGVSDNDKVLWSHLFCLIFIFFSPCLYSVAQAWMAYISAWNAMAYCQRPKEASSLCHSYTPQHLPWNHLCTRLVPHIC
jgi:hypothetical protein